MDEKAVPFFKAGKELRGRLNRDGPTASHAGVAAAVGIASPAAAGLLFRLGHAV